MAWAMSMTTTLLRLLTTITSRTMRFDRDTLDKAEELLYHALEFYTEDTDALKHYFGGDTTEEDVDIIISASNQLIGSGLNHEYQRSL